MESGDDNPNVLTTGLKEGMIQVANYINNMYPGFEATVAEQVTIPGGEAIALLVINDATAFFNSYPEFYSQTTVSQTSMYKIVKDAMILKN